MRGPADLNYKIQCSISNNKCFCFSAKLAATLKSRSIKVMITSVYTEPTVTPRVRAVSILASDTAISLVNHTIPKYVAFNVMQTGLFHIFCPVLFYILVFYIR